MLEKLNTMLSHKGTAIPGVLTVICGSGALFGMIPAPYNAILPGVCMIATGLGLIAAADATKIQPKQ